MGSDDGEGLAGVHGRNMDFSPNFWGNFLPDGVNGRTRFLPTATTRVGTARLLAALCHEEERA